MGDGKVLLDKAARVYELLQENGFTIAKQTVYNQCKAGGVFAPIRTGKNKGLFDAAQVLRAAMAAYADKRGEDTQVSTSTTRAPSPPLVLDNADKIAAEARLKQLQADKAEISLARQRGELTPTAVMDEELGKRARAFRLGLERFGAEEFEQVAALFGGEAEAARALLAVLGLPEDRVPLVVDFMLGRREPWRKLWSTSVERFLDAYATGTWWTEEMREVWEAWEKTCREKADA